MKTTRANKRVRFSNRSLMAIVDPLSPWASKLWYSDDETDHFKMRFSHDVHQARKQLGDQNTTSDKNLITIDSGAIVGLEKYLSHEVTVEYKNRRLDLQQTVLEEHRWHHAMQIPHSVRLAMVSTQKSRWARERARAAALFLEQEVAQDFEEMQSGLRNKADASKEEHQKQPFLRRFSDDSWAALRRSSILSV